MTTPNFEAITLALSAALEECTTEPEGALCMDPKRPEIARRRIRYIDAVARAALAQFTLACHTASGKGLK